MPGVASTKAVIDRGALRLVHGGGIAVIERRIIAGALKLTSRRSPLRPGPRASHPCFTSATVPKVPFFTPSSRSFFKEHHPVARGEVALAALDADGAVIGRQLARDLDPDLLPKLAALPEDRPRLQVQLAHVGPGVGQDERSFFRPLGGAVLTPLFDQLLLGLAPVLAEMDRAVLLVAIERPVRLRRARNHYEASRCHASRWRRMPESS